MNNLQRIKAEFNMKISKWYEDAKIDYDINGRFLDAVIDENGLTIFWEEEGKKYKMNFKWYEQYTVDQMYDIWMWSSCEWEAA